MRFPEFSGEWKKKYVENFCKIQTGSGNTQDKESEGTYPFFVRSPVVEHSNKYIFDCEAVLTVGDGVGTGKVYHYINGKFNCHQRVYAMTNFEKSVCARYFFYHFQKIFPRQVFAMSAKTSVDSIRRNMIAQLNMALPSINEQKKITQFFTLIDSRIEKQNQLVNVLKSYKRGLLARLFPKKGDTVPELRFKEFTADWEQRKLSDIVDVLDGDRGKNYPTSIDFDDSGHTLFLNASNVTNGGFLFQDNQFITEEKSNSMGNGKLEEDDIVITSRGSLGHIAWYNADISRSVPYARINSGMLILRNKKEVETEYLYHFMKSDKGQSQISFMSFGSAQPQLTKKGVESLEVVLPPKSDEQLKIGDYFEYLDHLITLHQQKLDMYTTVKKYLLQKMFV